MPRNLRQQAAYNDGTMPKIHYDVPDLRALSELARTGGFNRAAESLSITPSALSRRIAKLEAAVGGDLVVRSTRGMTLTSLGQRLLARSEPLLTALDDSVDEASRIARGLEGLVVLGCVSSIAYSLLPAAVANFRQRHENVRVSLRDGEGLNVTAALLDQEVEFAVTTLVDTPGELFTQLIASDPFVAVCSAKHPIAEHSQVSWQQLAQQRLVGFKASSYSRRALDDGLVPTGVELNWFYEVEQLSSLVGYLQSGHFVGVVPRLLSGYLRDIATIPISGPQIERRIHLARRRDTHLSVPASVLWDCIYEAVGSSIHQRLDAVDCS